MSVQDESEQATQGSARHTDAASIAAPGRNICARPIKGSAQLQTVGDHGALTELSDSIFTTIGVDVGLIEAGPDAARLVVFDVAITEGTSDGGC